MPLELKGVEFEIQGMVQGVWFRACTQETAKNLGLVGWVCNTASGSVRGEVQGVKERVEQMQEWLSKTGSPHSRIDSCEFTNERDLSGLEYTTFEVRRGRH